MQMTSFLPRTFNDWLYWIASLVLLTGLVLAIVSLFRVCSTECAESHNWRLFGMQFEYTGLLFFIPMLIVHWLARKNNALYFVGAMMLAGALGAEAKFILVQKYSIGTWCPICLSIAACIFVAAMYYGIHYITKLNDFLKHGPKGELMKSIWKGIAGVSVFVLGFVAAVAGISKFNPLESAENTIKESLYFGDSTGPIEVYVFTDWSCPACRELEPALEKMAPDILKHAKLTFVDHAIHTETLNYSPYNVSFMIKNKPEYFRLRDELTKLSVKTSAPTEEQIEKIAESQHVKYQQLNFADVALSQKYFKQLGKQFGITKTPTLVIVNTKTKKGKKLTGIPEITESNVLKAIESLQGTKEEAKK